MKSFQAVGMMVPLEDGLKKEQISMLLSMLPDDGEFIPFETSENNSSIIGFISTEAYDEHFQSLISLAQELCEDWNKEGEDKIYRTKSGLEVFIDS